MRKVISEEEMKVAFVMMLTMFGSAILLILMMTALRLAFKEVKRTITRKRVPKDPELGNLRVGNNKFDPRYSRIYETDPTESYHD